LLNWRTSARRLRRLTPGATRPEPSHANRVATQVAPWVSLVASLAVGIVSVVVACSANSIAKQQNSLMAQENDLVAEQQRLLETEAALLATQTVLMEEDNRIATSSLRPLLEVRYGTEERARNAPPMDWEEYIEIVNSGSPALEIDVTVLTVAIISIGSDHATAPSAFTADPEYFYDQFKWSGETATTGRVGYLVGYDHALGDILGSWPATDYQEEAGGIFVDRLHYLHIEFSDIADNQYEQNYLLDRRSPWPERITPQEAAEAAGHYADLVSTGAFYPRPQSGDELVDVWARYVGNAEGAFYR